MPILEDTQPQAGSTLAALYNCSYCETSVTRRKYYAIHRKGFCIPSPDYEEAHPEKDRLTHPCPHCGETELCLYASLLHHPHSHGKCVSNCIGVGKDGRCRRRLQPESKTCDKSSRQAAFYLRSELQNKSIKQSFVVDIVHANNWDEHKIVCMIYMIWDAATDYLMKQNKTCTF